MPESDVPYSVCAELVRRAAGWRQGERALVVEPARQPAAELLECAESVMGEQGDEIGVKASNDWDPTAPGVAARLWQVCPAGRPLGWSTSRKAHGADWTTFEDILAEASDYWRERHKPFWVFVS